MYGAIVTLVLGLFALLHSPEAIVSEKVKGLVAMLHDANGSSRVTAISQLRDSLPAVINFKEAEVLLESTGTYRNEALDLLADKLAVNLRGMDVAVILGDTTGSRRNEALGKVSTAGKIKSGLQVEEVVAILKGTENWRPGAIAILADRLATNLGGMDVAAILGDTTGSRRNEALGKISTAGKIKSGLQVEEVVAILKGTENWRPEAIAILVDKFAINLGGRDVAAILGDTTGSRRHKALGRISKGGKIKSDLTPDESQEVLKGMDSHSNEALKVLSPYLAR